MRNWLRINGQLNSWTAATVRTSAEKFPDLEVTRWQYQAKWISHLPHALALLNADQFKPDSNKKAVAGVFLPQAVIGQCAEEGIYKRKMYGEFDDNKYPWHSI